MKNIIKTISLLVLVCFSFFYTDKVMNIINQKDPLMIKIESLKEEYEVEPVNAMLDHDTIIPGINGRQIDVLKSYEEMKTSGIFREELLVYKDLYPSSLLSNNKDKYIIKGNNKENKVSLILILNIKNIDNIKEYSLKENNFTYKLTPYYYKGTFYINVKVNIKSLEGIKNIKDKYLVPIKITIKFNSGDIVTTKPEGSYDTITYYRYIQKNRDVIWSADNYVEGYTKTQ